MAMFHEVSKEIDLKINEILANIAGNKQQLMEGQTIMQSQTECGVVIKQTYMHPKKAKAVKRLDKFNKKIQKLQVNLFNNFKNTYLMYIIFIIICFSVIKT